MTKNILVLLIATLLLVACSSEENTNNASEATDIEAVIDDFNTFYAKFHADSSYQKAHVLFPLQGIPSNADSTTLRDQSFRWLEEEWIVQNELAPNSEFSSTILPVDSALVIEQIMHKSGDYAMERRFAKMGGEWKLIYYAGVNRVVK